MAFSATKLSEFENLGISSMTAAGSEWAGFNDKGIRT
jgi:hypothetical protein